jgi:hypothetical protein
VERLRLAEYPNPKEQGWEDKYRLAFARDTVFAEFLNSVKAWVKEAEEMEKIEKEEEKDILTA